jgi:hypothetical protein
MKTLLQNLIEVQDLYKKFEKAATLQVYSTEEERSKEYWLMARNAALSLEEALRELRVASINHLTNDQLPIQY